MSEYRVIAWKLSDFVGAGTILTSGMARINAKRPLAVTLTGDANKFEVSVKTADLNGSQHLGHEEQHLFLGSELKIGNTCLSAGSRIVPELTLNTASVAGVALIVGRIVNGSNVDTPETRLVFSSTRLEPEQVLNVVQAENVVPSGPGQNCFARGTMIDTPHGALPIEHLEDGDEVFTHDGNLQLISWIGQRRLSGLELVMNPSLQPVRIMAGALTGGRPGQDLIVS
ncbi:MAG: Hint domain-containing protein, partial [Paracoccaceae bacterium]